MKRVNPVMATTPTPWYSVDEIAQHMGVKRDTVYLWIEKRALPAHKVGRLWKFKIEEVDDWIRSGSAGEKAPDQEGDQ
ncbi:MAG: hypothetical protein PWP23_3147 [Candidatus Sumerlaeota bacterium]|nr:hypothetical protein [Candidatus Sumerlaeota bacterium]